ncbi:claret isoform a [Anaeramoeba flamelloides]|uniref:Claret isoform a n=1 Tax=Anaeramoeba flamelloides TaxID=1746091 RepID=A0AAV7Y7E9_9EUKA|nr:claret isoform a [Anaeramoeba flamelloides]
MQSKVWACGSISEAVFETKQGQLNLQNFNLTKIQGEIMGMSGSNSEICYFTRDNKFHCYPLQNNNNRKYDGFLFEDPDQDPISHVTSGFYQHCILTKSGRVFGWGEGSSNSLGGTFGSHWNKPKELLFFSNNNLKVIDASGAEFQTILLCDNGKLFGFGSNSYNQLGPNQGTIVDSNYSQNLKKDVGDTPTFLSDNVIMIGHGQTSRHHIYMTSDYTVWAMGDNSSGQLGIGVEISRSPSQKIKGLFNNKNIKQIVNGFDFSVILMNEEENCDIYSCGFTSAGQTSKTNLFKKLTFFNGKRIKQIYCGCYHTLAISEENKIYSIGKIGRGTCDPIHLDIPNFEEHENLVVASGVYFGLCYTTQSESLIQDFQNFLESEAFSDITISNCKTHKSILKFRLNADIDKISKILNNYTQKEVETILKWVYCDLIDDKQLLEKVLKHKFGIGNYKQKKLKNDLLQLYKNEESKDFNLLVLNDEDEEEEDEEEEGEEEQNFEDIPVHKFILLVRSGLFREMFQNVTQEINDVKDYSGKTIESIEVFIKYLYTDSISLTADDDPELILEELSDAKEYYQLNPNSSIDQELIKIKKSLK